MSFEETDKVHLERGATKHDFDAHGMKGILYKKVAPRKQAVEYAFYPYVNGEYANLRMDFEIASNALENIGEDDALKNMIYTFIDDLVEIASNVSKRMTNGNLFSPVIPAEAYEEKESE